MAEFKSLNIFLEKTFGSLLSNQVVIDIFLTKIKKDSTVLGNKNQNNTIKISSSTARLNKHVGVKMFKVLLLICSHMSILAASTRAKVTT